MDATEQTVYIVTAGQYSDYRIIAVFDADNLDAAQKCVEDTFEARIEIYEVNAKADLIRQNYKPHVVLMARNGETRHISEGNYSFDPETELIDRPKIPGMAAAPGMAAEKLLRCTVWAKNEEHAAKIVNEKRAQLIANNEWPEEAENT